MKIDRVYITCTRADLRLTRCCVASIRHWYPQIPIILIRDETYGTFDTAELQAAWNVGIFETERKRFGWGFSKLEPLFLPRGERMLILDSDIVFVGRVLDVLEQYDEDFIVADTPHAEEQLSKDYFDLAELAAYDPAFVFPGFVFNGGQLVGTTGILRRSDFEPLIIFSEPPKRVYPKIFAPGDQGPVNYILLKKRQQGQLTLRRVVFMWWANWLDETKVKLTDLTDQSPYPFLVHWAGPKYKMFHLMRNGHLLLHFEKMYLGRVAEKV